MIPSQIAFSFGSGSLTVYLAGKAKGTIPVLAP